MYYRKDTDKAFRRINVCGSSVPLFQDFTSAGQGVNCQDNEALEIESIDGSRHVEPNPNGRKTFSYKAYNYGFSLPKDCPTERLWVRTSDGTGIRYKVPNCLKISEERKLVLIPSGIANLELCGDEYFEAVFELQRL